MFAVGPNAIMVNWSPVPNNGGYTLRVASEPSLTDYSLTMTIDKNLTGAIVTGLDPGTTYWVGIRANATAPDISSNFSVSKMVVTPEASQSGTVGDLQTWLAGLQTVTQNASAELPQLENTELTPAARRRLLGSGVRRYGFIDKVSDTADEYPQFWPASAHGTIDFQDALKERLREIEVLRNVLVWLRMMERVVGDLLLIAGDDAFRMANTYYAAVRSAARSNLPGAPALYQLLRLFWRKRRGTSEEPTIREVERDTRALLRGNKDGTVTVRNESDTVIKGEKVVIDNTQRRPRGGVKIVEERE